MKTSVNTILFQIGKKLTRPASRKTFATAAKITGSLFPYFFPSYEVGKIRNWLNVSSGLKIIKSGEKSYPNLFPDQKYPHKMISMKNLINHYEVFILDIRGVIETEKEGVIEGVVETIKELQKINKPFIFLSNGSTITPEEFVKTFSGYGFMVNPEQIVTAGMLLKSYLEEKNLLGNQRLIVIGSSKIEENIRKAGAHPLCQGSIKRGSHEVKGVVIGDFDEIDKETLNAAINALRRLDIPAVLINPDEIYPTSGTEISLGAGSLGFLIERYSGKEMDKLGKPYPAIYHFALAKLPRIPKNKILVIGDTLENDILGARNIGLGSLLVLSGIDGLPERITTLEKRMLSTQVFPTYILPSIAL